ncbi:MAG TPA: SPASM domain-containing protein, partial [Exilispira sp.]|nr:SPASM domain-containing protein [Exilispira sp.]
IAGARSYIHINANGDVEPCAFIHYANVNIKEVSLFEALKSPLFVEYKKNQPFNENHLRPCPLLDNPEKLVEMVNNSNAYSTEVLQKEKPEEIYNRTIKTSQKWAIVADKLWKKSKNKQEEHEKAFVKNKA